MPRPERDEYREYEEACARIRANNTELLQAFGTNLSQRGLAAKTVKQHVENMAFYLNDYLLYEDAIPANEGPGHVAMYLGDWFIRKAMWSSAASIRNNAASLKKFYDFLAGRQLVPVAAVQEMKETIKEQMADWVLTVRRYDDYDGEDDEEF